MNLRVNVAFLVLENRRTRRELPDGLVAPLLDADEELDAEEEDEVDGLGEQCLGDTEVDSEYSTTIS